MTLISTPITRPICALFVLAAVSVLSAQRPIDAGVQAPITAPAHRTTADLMADAAADGGLPFWGADLINGTTFSAITLTETSTVPADPGIAAGPAQVIVIANGRLRSFNKATGSADGVLNLNPNTFFSSVRSGGSVFGGRIRFDPWTNRWFITMATDGLPGRVVIASSNSATITPATVWRFSGFDNTFGSGACAIDTPTLALDSQALYVGVNQFCDGAYAGTSAFVVRKSSAIDTAALFVTSFHNLTGTPGGPGLYAPRGVDNVEAAAATGYFVGVDNASFGRILLRRVSNPGGVPTLSADVPVAIPMTAATVAVPHMGNTGGADGRLNAGDDRLASVIWRGGQLWTVQTVGVTESGAAGASRNGARWYAIGSPDTTPVVAQSGSLHSSSGPGSLDERHYFNASLAVTGRGRAVLGFNTAGSNEFINGGTADRLDTDAPGSLRAPVLFTTAAAAYNPTLDPGSPSGRRWGRYSETIADGCDDMTAWTVQAFTDVPNVWTLQVARLRAQAPPAITGMSPASVPGGTASINLTLTTDGSAPLVDSPGFACRLAVAIPGVTVNSVTISGPSTLTVNVSTVNTAAGARTVTVTHPDGQVAASNLSLMVNAAAAMAIDEPLHAGQPLRVTGWAVDGRAQSGIGVDSVVAYAYPASGGPIFLGTATLGLSRTDVAASLGSRYLQSGFTLRATSVLPAGTYSVVVYAHSSATGEHFSRTANVTVAVPTAPFGHIDRPADGQQVAGEIGFTGWALDAGGIRELLIYREPVGGEPPGLVYVGKGDFLRGARPDVAAAFPGYPDNDAAGWGFMVLTNMLPNRGNGLFHFSVYVTNHAGLTTRIGTRTLVGANAESILPFGTIDTPAQGAEVSGVLVNFGWALTPSPLGIPEDASTITVFLDGVPVGHPVYNQYRPDIANTFPGLYNSNGAVGYFVIDTRLLADGLHSIAWSVRDRAGNLNGIGSRNFYVKNGS